MTATHTPIHILGIGSPFGDDQLGWRVVEALQDPPLRDRLPPAIVSITACDRPGSRLIDLIHGAEMVVLIDGIQSGHSAGTLVRIEGEQISPEAGIISTHGFGVASALGLARALGCRTQRMVFWGIEVGAEPALGMGSTLRHEIQGAVRPLAERVTAEVEGFLLERGYTRAFRG